MDMDALRQRADEIDSLAKNLNNTLTQLKNSNNIILKNDNNKKINNNKSNNSKTAKLFTPAQTELILSRLAKLKKMVQNYEIERIKEKKLFCDAIKHAKNELLQIKKDILVNNMKLQPDDFRKQLVVYLNDLKKELMQLNKKEKENQNNTNDNVLKKVRSDLITIKKEMEIKLKELNDYKIWEKEMNKFKKDIKIKLNNLKNEFIEYENELKRLKIENDDYKKGNLIPAKLKETINSKLSILKENVFAIETENKTFKMLNNNHFLSSKILKEYLISTIDLHVGGHSTRIIESGVLLNGSNLNEKRLNLMNNSDYYRKLLLLEPRCNYDSFGVIITESDDKLKSDFGCIFIDNNGYPLMCGNALIAVGRYAVDFNKINMDNMDDNKDNGNEVSVRIQCPCGIVNVSVGYNKSSSSSTGLVSFNCISSSLFLSSTINLDSFGRIEIDIASVNSCLYYIICSINRFKYTINNTNIIDLINIANIIKDTANKKFLNKLPKNSSFYGVILTDNNIDNNELISNICIFNNGSIDRSPNVDSIAARLCVDYNKNNIKLNKIKKFISKSTMNVFNAKILKEIKNNNNNNNNYKDIMVNISANANYISQSTFCLEKGDEIGKGFILK